MRIRYCPLVVSAAPGWRPYAASGSDSGGGEGTRWEEDEPGDLWVRGCEVDRIAVMAGEGSVAGTITDQDREWEGLVQGLPGRYPAGGSMRDALWRTLVGDRTHYPGCLYPAPQSYEEYYRAFRDVVDIERRQDGSGIELVDLLAGDHLTLEEFEVMSHKKTQFLETCRAVMIGRRFFVTEMGYLGAAPVSARVGDSVCVFQGGGVPYVVRASEAETVGWRFVGECYVHGIMAGEVLKREEFSWKDMKLR